MSDAAQNTPGPSFSIKGQYIKDLSFENPHAPHSLLGAAAKPGIDVAVNLKAQKLQDGVYETIVHISAKASVEGTVMFLVELAYGGIFQLTGVPDDKVEAIALVDCPFVLFPFARRVIADVTRDGGFPPLMLDPIDFHALYLQNKQS